MQFTRGWYCVLCCFTEAHAAAPDHVDITWMSITNMYFELGDQRIMADGYFTRLPESNFYGGGGGFKNTHTPALESFLDERGVKVIRPLQYMDKWRLDVSGIHPIPNDKVRKLPGFH